MSDLTRRVLEAHTRYTSPGLHAEQADIDGPLLIDAAPVLARQIEAVEELADRLNRLACEQDEAGNLCLASAVGTDAARIRDALTEATKETDQ